MFVVMDHCASDCIWRAACPRDKRWEVSHEWSIRDMNLLNYVQTVTIVVASILALRRWREAVQQRREQEQARLTQSREALEQRREEQRWRRTRLVWTLTDKIHEDKNVVPILEVIDHETDHLLVGGTVHAISNKDISDALHFIPERKRPDDFPDTSAKARAIRASFDALFYALERLDHARRLGLIRLEEVFPATKYYCTIIANQPHYLAYARRIGYEGAATLVEDLSRR